MNTERLTEGVLLAGRYEILDILGRGGMGTVYRARDGRLDTIVAVKEMIEPNTSAEERELSVRQFEREAKMLGQLTHPNLPRVTDYFTHTPHETEHCYLVMEFVEGRTLESLLREANGRALPLRETLNFAIQLADVLCYLHNQEPPIVFRDLKPANIMRVETGKNEGTIKLIDFGIARRFQAEATKDTLLYGSPGYSPPEQYGRTQTDPRSDIYALGATLHHLVTGRDPAGAPFKFPSVRSVDPALPAALDVFLSRCVAMEPEKRVQSAEEARDTLIQIRASLQENRKSTTKSTGPRPPSAKITSSRLQAVEQGQTVRKIVVASVLGLLVIGGGIFALSRMPRPKPAKPPIPSLTAAPETKRGNVTETTSETADAKLGTLVVRGTIDKATVLVDGTEVGVTPCEVANVAPGEHKIKIIPPDNSGLLTWADSVTVGAGKTVRVDAIFDKSGTVAAKPGDKPTSAPGSNGADTPVADISRVGAVPGRSSVTEVSLSVAFRLDHATGKKMKVLVLFYAPDGVTPLKPTTDSGAGSAYQTPEGHLMVVSQEYPVTTDPFGSNDLPLSLPANLLPTAINQATCRAVVLLDGKAVAQSQVVPLVTPGNG